MFGRERKGATLLLAAVALALGMRWSPAWASAQDAPESMLSDLAEWILVDNGVARFAIQKSTGKIKSAHVIGVPQEVVSNYPNYSLFFPELEYVYPDGKKEHYLPDIAGEVQIRVAYDAPDVAILDVVWRTVVIQVTWEYCFFRDRPFFIMRTERAVLREGVYANAQQCMMVDSAFDDGYVVTYGGDWHAQLHDRIHEGRIEYSMFPALDAGLGYRYPAFAWYDRDRDITCGAFVTRVSPNQRETMSYEMDGLIAREPPFGECQWNFFGKSDNETIYLHAGTRFGMEIYYYLDRGGVDRFDAFNRHVLQEDRWEERAAENYAVASWGGWYAGIEEFRWWFPQASNSWISSQERDHARSFGLPASQDQRPADVMTSIVKARTEDQVIHLTDTHGTHVSARTFTDSGRMVGEMVWEVGGLRHTLHYGVYPDSDKLLVDGRVEVLYDRPLKDLYVELWRLARVSEIATLQPGVFDFRMPDAVRGVSGITVYDAVGFSRFRNRGDHVRMSILANETNELYRRGDAWDYHYTLFPHLGYAVRSVADITPLHHHPEITYREYYKSVPGPTGSPALGVLPNANIYVLGAQMVPCAGVLADMDLFTREGEYPVQFCIDASVIGGVARDGVELPPDQWEFDGSRGRLAITRTWEEGRTRLTVLAPLASDSRTRLPVHVYPNPFAAGTSIAYELPFPALVSVDIYNLLGQRVRRMVEGPRIPGPHQLGWDGTDQKGRPVACGAYLCRVSAGDRTATCRVVRVR